MASGKRRRVAALLGFLAVSQEQLITKQANAVFVAKPIMHSNAPLGGGGWGRLRGSSVQSSAGCLSARRCQGVQRRGGEARRGRPASSIGMVFDQFDPRSRSKLIGRTYASDPALFKDIGLLDKHSSWTDPVIFSDQTALTPTISGALTSSVIRSLFVVAGFCLFPVLLDDLSPLLFMKDGALTDEIRLSLTGSFLPGVSLLFGALFSYTISLLVNRQIKIEEVVNAEVAALSVLVLHLEDYFRYSRNDLEASMEAAWRHTDTLIFQSRYQEILLLVQDDPLEDMMRLIIAVDDSVLETKKHRNKSGVHRDSLGYLRGVSSELIKLRTTRLSSEGRVLPPAHFGILIILASMLLFGFTLASAQPPTPEGPVKAAFESRVLFTLLLFSFTLLLEFALDLTNPFVGRYKVRRTTTTAVMIKIRSEIVAVMGTKHMTKFDKAFGLQKRRALRDFQRNTGMELPLDKQL